MLCADCDYPYKTQFNLKNTNIIIILWYGIVKWFSNLIQTTILNAYAPYKILDVVYMILVKFGSKNNYANTCTVAFFNPVVG